MSGQVCQKHLGLVNPPPQSPGKDGLVEGQVKDELGAYSFGASCWGGLVLRGDLLMRGVLLLRGRHASKNEAQAELPFKMKGDCY